MPSDESPTDGPPTFSDAAVDDALSAEDLYDVTYHATRAAVWDVLGDVVLTLLIAVIGLVALQLLTTSLFGGALLPAFFGAVLLAVAAGSMLALHGFWPFD